MKENSEKEDFIKSAKDSFKDQYGDAWEKVLYATANKRYGGDKNESVNIDINHDLINEIIDPDKIDVNDLEIKDELCPKIWDEDDILRPEVRKILLKNTMEFIKFAKLDDVAIEDVTITGSIANYNYTDQSDIDLHLIVDFSQISDDEGMIEEYFRSKKYIWMDKFPITIKGHELEFYVQNSNEKHNSTGVYSLIKNEWNKKPIKQMITLDFNNIKKKSEYFIEKINTLTKEYSISNLEKINLFMDKMKEYRQSGLDKGGEFSTENLVFKILRNAGYLDKIHEFKAELITKELTLENNQ